jgi:isopentenyl-diphosphate Delta-isomerase
MADELVDVCDEKNNLTGISKPKSYIREMGLWRRASHVWLYSSRGEVLIQLRAKSKKIAPNVWDTSVAGGLIAGETPEECAIRELREEIGLKADKNQLDLYKIMPIDSADSGIKNREFCYVFFLRFDGDVKNLKIQEDEIQKIKLMPLDELEKQLKSHREEYSSKVEWQEIIRTIRKKAS